MRLEPFQKRIVKEFFSPRRELLVLLPRGNGKTTLMAALAVHHVLTVERPAVYVAASSRDQARVMFEAARDFAAHPALDGAVTLRHLELRVAGGHLRVIASDAPRAHGLTPSLAIVDELHAHKDGELYIALRTAMLKRPGARMVTISTAGADADGALGRLRTRALGLPSVQARGPLAVAQGPSFAMLEWALPEGAEADDPRMVKRANPASWITVSALAEQREAVADGAFRRFHGNQWTVGEQSWLPAGSWQACASNYGIEPGEEIYVGVDVGGSRAASAVVWVTADLRLGVAVYQGDAAVLEVAAKVRELATEFTIREVAFDPWRFRQAALELEQDGLLMVEFQQSNSRMVPASERLYAAIIERRLQHPDDAELNRHVGQVIAKQTPRGLRIDRPGGSSGRAQIDAVIALAMSLERAEAPAPAPVELVGWL